MKNVLQSISIAAGLALSAAFAVPADAYTVTLRPLEPQVQPAAHIAVLAACSKPAANAAVDGTAFFEVPEIAAAVGASGTSVVMISLSSTGALRSQSIVRSSGNPNLDRAALLSARMTKFSPEIQNCAAVGGTYLYTVDF